MTTLAAQLRLRSKMRSSISVSPSRNSLERDLAMAREVQLRLLPPVKPQHKRRNLLEVPARAHHRGDLYDFCRTTQTQRHRAGRCERQSGCGALYAALVSGIMRSVAPQHLSPRKC